MCANLAVHLIHGSFDIRGARGIKESGVKCLLACQSAQFAFAIHAERAGKYRAKGGVFEMPVDVASGEDNLATYELDAGCPIVIGAAGVDAKGAAHALGFNREFELFDATYDSALKVEVNLLAAVA